LEEEVKKLRLENAELKIERDMLKKAAAYVCPEEAKKLFQAVLKMIGGLSKPM
jgi:hypothetical protein